MNLKQYERKRPCPNLRYGTSIIGDTRSRSWLRHYATSRMVAGSIHDGVIGIFH